MDIRRNNPETVDSPDSDRRHFLRAVLSAPAIVSPLSLSGQDAGSLPRSGLTPGLTPEDPQERRQRAFQIRRDTAAFERDQPIQPSVSNSDEQRYAKANYIANYSKALPHDARGEVDSRAYRQYLNALRIGTGEAIEAIPKGGPLRLSNPQAAFSYSLEGLDPHVPFLQPAPAFESAEQAAEMIELYWLALARDVPFTEYSQSAFIEGARAELSKLSGYT